jgi:Family of unknown function (DUF6275)
MSETVAPPSEASDHMAFIAAATPNRPRPPQANSNRFTDRAKQLVVDNYNAHHNGSRTPQLKIEQVYIVSFTKIVDFWKATVGSALVRGLLYEVTYNPAKAMTIVEVYKKINIDRIPD